MSEIESTGGSSDYYKIRIPKECVFVNVDHVQIEVKDVIRYALNNDFTFGNVFKALVRIVSKRNGVGKKGADIEYDLNKCKFFLDEELQQIKIKDRCGVFVNKD